MIHKLNHTHYFEAIVKTPVCIGSVDDTITSLGAYIYDANKLHYVDLKRVISAEGFSQQQVDKLVADIQYFLENNKLTTDFADLLKNNFNINLDDIKTGKSYPVKGLSESRTLALKTLLKTNKRPYLSGSTIKGAIKATILYDWLRREEGGKPLFEKFIQQHLLTTEVKNLVRRYTNSKSLKPDRDLQRELDQCKKRLNDAFMSEVEEKLFGGFDKNLRFDSSLFKIPDTPSVDDKYIVVECVKRFNLKYQDENRNGALGIPQLVETVAPETAFQLQIKLDTGFTFLNKHLRFLHNRKENKDFSQLLGIINRFADDFIAEELASFKTRTGAISKTFYGHYLGLKGINPQHECLLRIGFGKHFMNNSIGLALKKTSKEAYQLYAKLFDNKADEIDFPHTRTLTANDKFPMGWLLLRYKQTQNATEKP